MYSRIPATSGIYRITCTVTGLFYIGSAINLQNRSRQHFHELRHNTHRNPKLQRAFNKYGEDAFTYEVIELVLPISLTAREQYWLNKLKPFGERGYNIALTAGSNFGRKASPEAREKLRVANLGKKMSEDNKRKLIEANKGKTQRPEHIEKRRLARLGYTPSAEIRTKLKIASTKQMKALIVTAPDGMEYTILGIGAFCKEHCLSHASLLKVARGEYNQHKGYKARFPN